MLSFARFCKAVYAPSTHISFTTAAYLPIVLFDFFFYLHYKLFNPRCKLHAYLGKALDIVVLSHALFKLWRAYDTLPQSHCGEQHYVCVCV